jgi:hypothetical protein
MLKDQEKCGRIQYRTEPERTKSQVDDDIECRVSQTRKANWRRTGRAGFNSLHMC